MITLESVGELRLDLVLLVRREDVYDPVYGLRRVLGVEGPEHEVAVSAAVTASEMVSRSRISPTSITSGSCRRTCLRPQRSSSYPG